MSLRAWVRRQGVQVQAFGRGQDQVPVRCGVRAEALRRDEDQALAIEDGTRLTRGARAPGKVNKRNGPSGFPWILKGHFRLAGRRGDSTKLTSRPVPPSQSRMRGSSRASAK